MVICYPVGSSSHRVYKFVKYIICCLGVGSRAFSSVPSLGYLPILSPGLSQLDGRPACCNTMGSYALHLAPCPSYCQVRWILPMSSFSSSPGLIAWHIVPSHVLLQYAGPHPDPPIGLPASYLFPRLSHHSLFRSIKTGLKLFRSWILSTHPFTRKWQKYIFY